MKPLVSVIVPTYNEEKYLERTLVALKNQNYKGTYEIIVVDGRSMDKTVEIAKEYADKVFIAKRKGVAFQKNFGATKADGDILIFLDADTILPKNYLQKVTTHFRKNKPAMVVGKFIPDEGHVKANFTVWIWNEFLPNLSRLLQKPGYGGPSTFAVDRKVFESVGGFNKNLKIFEDWEFCTRVLDFGKIIYEKKLHPVTSMRKFERNGYAREYIWWTKQYLRFFLKRNTNIKSYTHVE